MAVVKNCFALVLKNVLNLPCSRSLEKLCLALFVFEVRDLSSSLDKSNFKGLEITFILTKDFEFELRLDLHSAHCWF